jgi:hypothetical protein
MAKPRLFDQSNYVDCPPALSTAPEDLNVLTELAKREPIFHRPEFGTTRRDFENMTVSEYWEVGASGRRYNREYVLDELARRYEDPEYHGIHSPAESNWQTKDFNCFKIATDNYLLTYTLAQGPRITRRSTIWRRCGADWKIVYHQGTIVQGS